MPRDEAAEPHRVGPEGLGKRGLPRSPSPCTSPKASGWKIQEMVGRVVLAVLDIENLLRRMLLLLPADRARQGSIRRLLPYSLIAVHSWPYPVSATAASKLTPGCAHLPSDFFFCFLGGVTGRPMLIPP